MKKQNKKRKKSLETFGEAMKRKSIENDEKQTTSKCRNNGSERLKFLQEKASRARNGNATARD